MKLLILRTSLAACLALTYGCTPDASAPTEVIPADTLTNDTGQPNPADTSTDTTLPSDSLLPPDTTPDPADTTQGPTDSTQGPTDTALSPADTDSDTAPDVGPDNCIDNLEFFEANIWTPVLATDCISCHITGGQAQDTRLVLDLSMDEAALQANYETLRILAEDVSQGDAMLLLKPTGQIPHQGGLRFALGSETYAHFEEMVARYKAPEACENPLSTDPCEGVIAPGPSPIRRLTAVQYANTIEDLFPGLTIGETAFPPTTISGGFTTYAAANIVSAAGSQGIFEAAETVSAAAVANLSALINCAGQSEVACISEFIKTFGLRVFRRPLTNEEIAALFAVYQQAPLEASLADRIGRLLESFLQSPQLLYLHAEAASPLASQPDVAPLTHYALASRLSFFIWNTMPDEILFARAAAGDLNNPQAISEEVARLLADPRATAVITRFHEEWLHLYHLDGIEKDIEAYPSFTPTLSAAMSEEMRRLVTAVLVDGDGLLSTLLQTTDSFVNPELAQLYGVDVGALGPDEWVWTSLGEDRPGILTRAAFATVQAYAHASSPIHRGHFLLQDFLCQKLVIPPIAITELPEAPNGTVKDRLEMHRSDPVCGSCHDRIDPLGLAFEHYDGIGRYRSVYSNGLPVDASGNVSNPAVSFDNATELITQLSTLDEVQRCYATQWYRFASGRGNQPIDSCTLSDIHAQFLESGGNVPALIAAIAQSDGFRYRAVPQTPEDTDD